MTKKGTRNGTADSSELCANFKFLVAGANIHGTSEILGPAFGWRCSEATFPQISHCKTDLPSCPPLPQGSPTISLNWNFL